MLLSRQDLTLRFFLSLISLFLSFPISFLFSVSLSGSTSLLFSTHQQHKVLSCLFSQVMISKIKSLYSLFLLFFQLFSTCPFLLLNSNTSPSWSLATGGVGTCPPLSSSAAGWSGRGRWRSDAGQSFSGAALRRVAESLGGLASAAAPANGAPSPGAARWASHSAGLDGLDGGYRDREDKSVTLHGKVKKRHGSIREEKWPKFK